MTRSQGTPSAGRVSARQVDAVMDAARVLVAVVAASVAEVEDTVTLPQLRVLVMARAQDPLTLSDVARSLGLHASNATRTCDRLVVAGLLDRQDDPADRRQVQLSLTPSGAELVDSLMQHRRSAVQRVVQRMDPAQREQLSASMTAFAAAAGELPEEQSTVLPWPPRRQLEEE